MFHQLLLDKVDIYSWPSKTYSSQMKQLTIGDLHANVIKFLFVLIQYSFIHLDETTYQDLVAAYLSNYNRKSMNLFLSKLKNHCQVLNKTSLVRLIGDETADRGVSDVYMFYTLAQLKQAGLNYEILLSNHGLESLYFYLFLHQESFLINQVDHGKSTHLLRSLLNLKLALAQGWIQQQDFIEYFSLAYLPHLKLLSYSFSNKHISIYSHAPIDLQIIRRLCEQYDFSLEYDDTSPLALGETIDELNRRFHNILKNNPMDFYELFDKEDMSRAYINSKLKPAYQALSLLIWNRDYQRLNRFPKHPEYHYAIYYIHGHDKSDPEKNEAYVFSIDNDCGKSNHNLRDMKYDNIMLASYDYVSQHDMHRILLSLLAELDSRIKCSEPKLDDKALEILTQIQAIVSEKSWSFQRRYQRCLQLISDNLVYLEDHPWWKIIFLRILEFIYDVLGMQTEHLHNWSIFKPKHEREWQTLAQAFQASINHLENIKQGISVDKKQKTAHALA